MAKSEDWDIFLHCKRNPNHSRIQVMGCELDVDGHIVVPKQKPCGECTSRQEAKTSRLSRLEIRRWEKKLFQQIKEL